MLFPEAFTDLLDRPLFAHVATVRPDGVIQSNPMWYAWDGESIRLTTTTDRRKHRNITTDPRL
nr:pyridoxamine 5'-phosphate oxidase family protein [Micromonospora sp. DSM 115978]